MSYIFKNNNDKLIFTSIVLVSLPYFLFLPMINFFNIFVKESDIKVVEIACQILSLIVILMIFSNLDPIHKKISTEILGLTAFLFILSDFKIITVFVIPIFVYIFLFYLKKDKRIIIITILLVLEYFLLDLVCFEPFYGYSCTIFFIFTNQNFAIYLILFTMTAILYPLYLHRPIKTYQIPGIPKDNIRVSEIEQVPGQTIPSMIANFPRALFSFKRFMPGSPFLNVYETSFTELMINPTLLNEMLMSKLISLGYNVEPRSSSFGLKYDETLNRYDIDHWQLEGNKKNFKDQVLGEKFHDNFFIGIIMIIVGLLLTYSLINNQNFLWLLGIVVAGTGLFLVLKYRFKVTVLKARSQKQFLELSITTQGVTYPVNVKTEFKSDNKEEVLKYVRSHMLIKTTIIASLFSETFEKMDYYRQTLEDDFLIVKDYLQSIISDSELKIIS